MPTLWFSTYYGDPDLYQLEKHGVNELFATQVRLVRELFKTQKSRIGLDTGTGTWVPYELLNTDIEIRVDRFEWGKFVRMGGTLTPQMTINFRFRKQEIIYPDYEMEPLPDVVPQKGGFSEWLKKLAPGIFGQPEPPPPPPRPRRSRAEPTVVMKEFYSETLTVWFPANYPNKPPIFRLENRQIIADSPSHRHHTLGNGILCILADSDDWTIKDNLKSGLNAAFSWCLLHYNNFGW